MAADAGASRRAAPVRAGSHGSRYEADHFVLATKLKAQSANAPTLRTMRAGMRVTNWLRFACALVLTAGLSSAVAATVTGSPSAPTVVPAVSQLGVSTAAVHSIAVRGATTVRHAAGKHQPPAMGGALAAVGILLTGLVALAVLRRRDNPALRHLALSHGARAPPAVSFS